MGKNKVKKGKTLYEVYQEEWEKDKMTKEFRLTDIESGQVVVFQSADRVDEVLVRVYNSALGEEISRDVMMIEDARNYWRTLRKDGYSRVQP